MDIARIAQLIERGPCKSQVKSLSLFPGSIKIILIKCGSGGGYNNHTPPWAASSITQTCGKDPVDAESVQRLALWVISSTDRATDYGSVKSSTVYNCKPKHLSGGTGQTFVRSVRINPQRS